jgi:glycosyltransferase involved in cell wall biosynthesis
MTTPESEYVTFEQTPTKPYTHVFMFIIPQREVFQALIEKFKPDVLMTVCETEPVHEDYRLVFETGKKILVPSQFCKDVFLKQFPWAEMDVFPHWPGGSLGHGKSPGQGKSPGSYTFYTIGNMLDRRKNADALLRAFLACNFGPNVRLVIKATCKEPVHLKVPGVLIMNGLVSDEQMDRIHDICDCYINFSKSEGVGMGAVEAAVRNKPVIITSFGGLKEYLKTPFVVECSEECVGTYDFLYEPHMKWGNPSVESLIRHMKHCVENNIRTWDHSHTREFTSRDVLCAKLSELGRLALAGSSIDVSSLADCDGSGCGNTDHGDWELV